MPKRKKKSRADAPENSGAQSLSDTLVLGWVGDRPVHVVAASAPAERIVITVYEPDLARWEPGFKKRKQ